LPPWDAWSPHQALEYLSACGAPWWLAGGWSLEAHAGLLATPRREHSDLDLALLRPHLPMVREHLKGWDLQIAHEGTLTPLRKELPWNRHALWCRPSADHGWAFELLINDTSDDQRQWVFRRDERVRLPVANIGETGPEGVPHLVPQIVLLFKAARARPVDQEDLQATLPHLRDDERCWLNENIRLVHPEHPWLAHTA
jgi:hypothetical protein